MLQLYLLLNSHVIKHCTLSRRDAASFNMDVESSPSSLSLVEELSSLLWTLCPLLPSPRSGHASLVMDVESRPYCVCVVVVVSVQDIPSAETFSESDHGHRPMAFESSSCCVSWADLC